METEDLKKAVEERVKEEAKTMAAAEKKKAAGGDPRGTDGKITSKFVQECLGANEFGDGVLFAAIHGRLFLFNTNTQSWLEWDGHHWIEVEEDEVLSGAEDVARQYLIESERVGNRIRKCVEAGDKEGAAALLANQTNLYKHVYRIRSSRGRKHCVEFARANPVNSLSIPGNKFNTNPLILGHGSGVLDLTTGESRPGRRNDYISKFSPVEFLKIDTPAPHWENFLNEIFDNNQSLIDYIARLFGYFLSGLTIERFMPIFYGAHGNNGKTTLIEVISHIMGPLASPIEAEMLLDQGRAKSAGSASPEIASLRDLRFAYASETDAGRRFSISKVKWLIGSDSMTGRFLYEKRAVVFTPTHKLVLLTNNKPDVSGDDSAFWEKIHVISFPLSFVLRKPVKDFERCADKYLRQKLLKEAPGILAWQVRGCLDWQKKGLAPPPAVIDASKEYRRSEDLIQSFIDDCCFESSGAEVTARDLYDTFKKWFEINVSRRALSQKKFGSLFGKKFQRSKSGICKYFGIGLLESENWD